MVRSIGADRIVNYTVEDFTRGGQPYDLIVDNIGNHSLSDLRRVLTAKGTLVLIGGGAAGCSDRWPHPIRMTLSDGRTG